MFCPGSLNQPMQSCTLTWQSVIRGSRKVMYEVTLKNSPNRSSHVICRDSVKWTSLCLLKSIGGSYSKIQIPWFQVMHGYGRLEHGRSNEESGLPLVPTFFISMDPYVYLWCPKYKIRWSLLSSLFPLVEFELDDWFDPIPLGDMSVGAEGDESDILLFGPISLLLSQMWIPSGDIRSPLKTFIW